MNPSFFVRILNFSFALFCLFHYAGAQSIHWVETYGSKRSYDYTYSLEQSSSGEILIGGIFNDSVTVGGQLFEKGGFVLIHDTLGNLKQALPIDDLRTVRGAVKDAAGNVYVAGTNSFNSPSRILKYLPNGQIDWYKNFTDITGGMLQFDHQGYLIFAFGSDDTLRVSKIDPSSGQELWVVKHIYPGTTGGVNVSGLAIDPTNNLYLAVGESQSAREARLVKITQNGSLIHNVQLDGLLAYPRLCFAEKSLFLSIRVVDSLVHSNGAIHPVIGHVATVIAELDTSFQVIHHELMETNQSSQLFRSIQYDGHGGLFISGHIDDSLYFKQNLLVRVIDHNRSALVIKFDLNLNPAWTFTPGPFSEAYAVFANRNEVYFSGLISSHSPTTFGGLAIPSTGQGDGFLAKLSNSPLLGNHTLRPKQNDWVLFPNPSKDKVFVSLNSQISRVQLYTSSGILLREYAIDAWSDHPYLDLSNQPDGTYLIRIETPQGWFTKPIMKQ